MSANKSKAAKTLVLVLFTITLLAIPLGSLAAPAQPANGITAPTEGANVSGAVSVTGYADDPKFDRWQLDVLAGGDASKVVPLTIGKKSGSFTYVMDANVLPLGAHVLRLRIVRPDGNYQEFLTNFSVVTPGSGPAAPMNGITAPADGETVSGVVAVTGYANDLVSFARWQLDILPGGDTTAAPIPVTVSSVPGYFSHSLDTTASPAGAHALRLRVVRPDGNYTESLTSITVGPAPAATPIVIKQDIRDPGGP